MMTAVIAAGVLGGTAGAQELPKVALYIANDKLTPDDKSFLTRKFLAPFTASGKYDVIDRSDIFTKKAAVERIKQRDGSVNDKEIYKIGLEAGAQYILMVEMSYSFGRWNIGARMVDVVTAKVYLAQGETDIRGSLDDADFSVAAQTIFDKIHGGKSSGAGSGGGGGGTQAQQYQTPAPAPTYQQSGVDGSGAFTDSRDGKRYKTVVIGGKRWMWENLNYQTSTSGSWCYSNDNSNCGKYGRLYDWKTAKTVCPAGFHLSSREEWVSLVAATGGKDAASKKLKARNGWNNREDESGGNGTDDFGFSALPGGYRSSDGDFDGAGNRGLWWTATEDGGSGAYYRYMHYYGDNVYEYHDGKDSGYSVRCVKD